MTVKIVTDSTSDIPKEAAEELGITVIPLNVHFGLDSFRDGVDIHSEEFYQRLVTSPTLPTTSAPSPGIFTECYNSLADGADIVSIHISSRLSATYEAALAGKRDVEKDCQIEVCDSRSVSMGLGLIAVAAAKAAKEGASLEEVKKVVQDAIDTVFVVVGVDTLEYLQKGGRMGKAQALVGSLLSIKPILALQDGEVFPKERVRTHGKAVARMYELLEEQLPAKELAVVYSTDPEEARKMVLRLKEIAPKQSVRLACFGPVLGVHTGPNALGIAALS